MKTLREEIEGIVSVIPSIIADCKSRKRLATAGDSVQFHRADMMCSDHEAFLATLQSALDRTKDQP